MLVPTKKVGKFVGELTADLEALSFELHQVRAAVLARGLPS